MVNFSDLHRVLQLFFLRKWFRSEGARQIGHFPKSRSIGGSSPVKDPARINQKRIERHCRARLRSTSAGLSCRRDVHSRWGWSRCSKKPY
ncbi:hypothetical protein HID58_055270 [Brassica napus]|uniref:Uncharacterized protein n=1 Tax=Brassica napus TaxID=3708 RepID=A0ABQ8AJU9_BRANA|nr:hypothetical protein HID58_055270 [Brassica napus]